MHHNKSVNYAMCIGLCKSVTAVRLETEKGEDFLFNFTVHLFVIIFAFCCSMKKRRAERKNER